MIDIEQTTKRYNSVCEVDHQVLQTPDKRQNLKCVQPQPCELFGVNNWNPHNVHRAYHYGDTLASTLFTCATMDTTDGVMSAQVQSQGDCAHHYCDTWKKTGPGEPEPYTG